MSVRIPDTQRVRAELNNFVKTGTMNDQISGGPGIFARGSNLRFEFALFYGEELADPSAITTARLRILNKATPNGNVAMDKTIGITAMKPGMTLEEWNNGGLADCHLAFEFSAAECAPSVFAGGTDLTTSNSHWFQLTYGPADTTWFCGTLTSIDPGYDAPGNAPPSDPSNVSREEVAAQLAAFGQQFVKFAGNPAGATVELTSRNSSFKVKLGCDDEGNQNQPTQVTT